MDEQIKVKRAKPPAFHLVIQNEPLSFTTVVQKPNCNTYAKAAVPASKKFGQEI